MPYIKKEKRNELDNLIDILTCHMVVKGDYNYVITKILHNYIEDTELCYDNLNDAQGIIECVGKEFYRTVVAPYEDKKKKENGAISDLDKENKNED